MFRTFKASCRFACAHPQVVRGATVWEFTTIPSDCQIRPSALFGGTAVPNSAVSHLQHNEGEFYHTLQGLSNSHPCLPWQSDRWILFRFSARRRLPVRGATRVEFTTPLGAVKSMPPCSHNLAVSRFVRCSPVHGATRDDYTVISRSCQIRPGVLLNSTRSQRHRAERRSRIPAGSAVGNDSGLVYTSAWHVNSAERSSFTWAMWRIFIPIRGETRCGTSGFRRQTRRPYAYQCTVRPPTPVIEQIPRSPQVRPQCQFLSIVRWRRHPQPS